MVDFTVNILQVFDDQEKPAGAISRHIVIKEPDTSYFVAVVRFPNKVSFRRTCREEKVINEIAAGISQKIHTDASKCIKQGEKYQIARVLLVFDNIYNRKSCFPWGASTNRYGKIKTSHNLRMMINEAICRIMTDNGHPGYNFSRVGLLINEDDMHTHRHELGIKSSII
jgi:hypothetical protein